MTFMLESNMIMFVLTVKKIKKQVHLLSQTQLVHVVQKKRGMILFGV